MTTKQEYEDAAHRIMICARYVYELPKSKPEHDALQLAIRVLRQLAKGAVLCKPQIQQESGTGWYATAWYPIEEQP